MLVDVKLRKYFNFNKKSKHKTEFIKVLKNLYIQLTFLIIFRKNRNFELIKKNDLI